MTNKQPEAAEVKLENCPFCGSEKVQIRMTTQNDLSEAYYAACEKCDCRTSAYTFVNKIGVFTSPELAASHWNTRAQSSQTEVLKLKLERAEDVLKEIENPLSNSDEARTLIYISKNPDVPRTLAREALLEIKSLEIKGE